jgi:hypothetical protein
LNIVVKYANVPITKEEFSGILKKIGIGMGLF